MNKELAAPPHPNGLAAFHSKKWSCTWDIFRFQAHNNN